MPAQTPVSCSHGDIFCRECALNNILAQKKEIKRLEKTREHEAKEAEEDQLREEAEAKERAVQEFEKIQMGLEAKVGKDSASKKIVGREDGKIIVEEDSVCGKRGEKRKFELDEDELLRIARDERTKARKALNEEKVCDSSSLFTLCKGANLIAGLQNNSSLLLGSIDYPHFKHKHNFTYYREESQTGTRVS